MVLWQLIIMQTVTFVVLVLVLRKIMYSASAEEVKRLKQLEEENSRKRQELIRKIEEMEKEHKARINIAEDEARRLKEQAKSEAEAIKEEAILKAKQESERIISQAMSRKDEIKEEVESEIEERCVELSYRLLLNILSSESQKLFQEGFVEEVLKDIEKIEESKLSTAAETGELISPYKMDKDKKDKISGVLSKKAGKKISLNEKIDKELVAGIIIKLGSLVIDGSLRGRLRDAMEITIGL